MKLYGIPNCDTVKKARAWLTAHQQEHSFHDFKKEGAGAELLAGWVARLDWQTLLNKQGTTWRKLDPARQALVVDAASAIALMQEQPSLIKRPVLEHGERLLVGFKPEHYEDLI
ncbi:ArsC family reductase [Chitinimonas arctica]|uniref:ArsC family reductase n=1 Tax=Chitinimonas arctica TaxID=2594795 RepID=A0A516SGS3_9NEIS|nr:ArsC family reductase [Chitinimonas arctica]QDQ27369.1 ArsC family reductase [Chitinimonas arctica]